MNFILIHNKPFKLLLEVLLVILNVILISLQLFKCVLVIAKLIDFNKIIELHIRFWQSYILFSLLFSFMRQKLFHCFH